MHFLVNETMKLTLYICRSMTNLKLRFLKLLYFSLNILVILTYFRLECNHLHTVHTESVSLSSNVTQSRASVYPLSSEFHTVAVAASLYRIVSSAQFFHLLVNFQMYNLLI